MNKRSLGCLIVVATLAAVGVKDACAARGRKVTITYTGSGSASLQESYSRTTSSPCTGSVSNSTTTESATTDCPAFSKSCSSTLGLFAGIPPGLTVEKSGKSFIVSVVAEQQTQGGGATGVACMQSSVFDNAIVEGMNGINITRVRIKLTPKRKKNRAALLFPVGIQKTYDCADPARNGPPFLSNACTLTTSFVGSVAISGKWKATLIED